MKIPRRKERPQRQYRKVRCERCDGSGRVLDGATGRFTRCPVCNGKGQIDQRRQP